MSYYSKEDLKRLEKIKKTLKNHVMDRELCPPDIENLLTNSFHIVFKYTDVTFALLQKISKAFGTTNINFGSETRDDGYCDTCSSPYSATIVRVEDVTKGM